MQKTLKEICAAYDAPQQIKAQGLYPYYRPISSTAPFLRARTPW